MGDSSYVEFHIKLSDEDSFRAMVREYIDRYGNVTGNADFKFDDESETDKRLILGGYANYGYYDEIESMAKDLDCPPFICYQGPGDEYGPAVHVVIDGYHVLINTDNDFYPTIQFMGGEITYDNLAYLRMYTEVLNDVEKHIDFEEDPEEDYYTETCMLDILAGNLT